jgi:methionyl-tRNA formyltransferase
MVNHAHVELIKQIWPKLIDDSIVGVKQDETKATYWEGRTPADGELFKTMSILEVDKLVRATTRPYPGAFIKLDEINKLIIWGGSTQPIQKSKSISFCDGIYYASDFEIVPIK